MVPKLKLVIGEEADRARARILEVQARSRASKRIVASEEFDRARARILEDQARSRASKQNFRYRPSMLCKVCKLVGDSVSLTKHSIEECVVVIIFFRF